MARVGEYADYYERAIYNYTRLTNPGRRVFILCVKAGPKAYSTPFDSLVLCRLGSEP